jgi:hypothetical protein
VKGGGRGRGRQGEKRGARERSVKGTLSGIFTPLIIVPLVVLDLHSHNLKGEGEGGGGRGGREKGEK